MANLYEIIDDLRREHPNPAASRTLDMVVAEMGVTRDNLHQALARLEGRPLPAGAEGVLQELEERARAEGVDDLRTPATKEEVAASLEPIDESQIGIAALLGGSAAVAIILTLLVIGISLNQIFHFV